MFETKYFVNLNTKNQLVLTDFGKVVFERHIAIATNQQEYDFLKSYKECFEIDKQKYLANEEQLTNEEIFRNTIESYRVEDKPKAEQKAEKPSIKQGVRKSK